MFYSGETCSWFRSASPCTSAMQLEGLNKKFKLGNRNDGNTVLQETGQLQLVVPSEYCGTLKRPLPVKWCWCSCLPHWPREKLPLFSLTAQWPWPPWGNRWRHLCSSVLFLLQQPACFCWEAHKQELSANASSAHIPQHLMCMIGEGHGHPCFFHFYRCWATKPWCSQRCLELKLLIVTKITMLFSWLAFRSQGWKRHLMEQAGFSLALATHQPIAVGTSVMHRKGQVTSNSHCFTRNHLAFDAGSSRSHSCHSKFTHC